MVTAGRWMASSLSHFGTRIFGNFSREFTPLFADPLLTYSFTIFHLQIFQLLSIITYSLLDYRSQFFWKLFA